MIAFIFEAFALSSPSPFSAGRVYVLSVAYHGLRHDSGQAFFAALAARDLESIRQIWADTLFQVYTNLFAKPALRSQGFPLRRCASAAVLFD